ncbi:MAG: response regulator transcription factor [Eubacterium sp.]|nr:response regulator transcription factor [Eubacterium sp.]
MHKILVVEDDDTLASALEFSLTDAGYSCSIVGTFREAKKILEEGNRLDEYSLLIFDVMLPDGNGYDLLTLYKERGIITPVIYLTAVSDEGSIVKGLDLGADDYITKPFRNAELLSRVRAVIRRYDPVKEETGFVYRELVVDTNAATVKLSGEVIPLSSSEYKLLVYFLENQGICLTRSNILEKIFDESGNFVDDSALYVYVNRLRDKIGDLKRKDPYIRTVRGIGYRMEKI